MKKWVIRSKKADFPTIMEKHKISEVTARLLANRDIIEEEEIRSYLEPNLEGLFNPMELKDMDKACMIIQEKITNSKKIRIIGDYDVDGIAATYILYQGLVKCGAKVDFEIPDRVKDGYGINSNIIHEAYKDGIDTILTCDNGISAIEQVKLAKEMGMTVIITDHHEISFTEDGGKRVEDLPNGDAIINPKQEKCTYPNKILCGAAVAFKLVQALYTIYKIEDKEWYSLLEIVAIATVCDVMDLIGENRILVKLGIDLLKNTKNYGLNALMELSNIHINKLSAYHLNASGRLDTAKKGLNLLLAQSKEEAYKLAKELKELNDIRKDMTAKGVELAIKMIEETTLKEDKVLVVYLPDCHESIEGIIAGRIREKYNKPSILLTKSEEGVKGSGKSIEQYNMNEELKKCSNYLSKFGGHPMAAGLSLEEKNINNLREQLNENTRLTKEDLIAKVTIDIVLPLGFKTEELIEELEVLEPFGKGNTKPVFAERNIKVIKANILGKNQNVCKLNIINKYGKRIDAMLFGQVEPFLQELTEKFGKEEVDKMFQNRQNKITFSITYYPNINEYNGKRTTQIIINNYLI